MSKSTLSGEEAYRAIRELFTAAARAQVKIRGLHLNHETIADLLKSSDGISINVLMGLRSKENMQLLGVPVYAKFNVKNSEIGVLFEKTYQKLDLKDYLPIRPWWERLDGVDLR